MEKKPDEEEIKIGGQSRRGDRKENSRERKSGESREREEKVKRKTMLLERGQCCHLICIQGFRSISSSQLL